MPKDGCLNFLSDNDEVLVTGFGRKGHAVGDIPGIRFKVIAVRGISLKKLYLGKATIRRWGFYYAHGYGLHTHIFSCINLKIKFHFKKMLNITV